MTDTNKGNYYIIADHLRTTIFALADGAIFEPKGRGYILKKLVKKVALLAYFFNLARENLRAVSEELIAVNSSYYPYLLEKKSLIISVMEKELGKSQQLISKVINKLDNCFSPTITVQDIFFWYDTQGIPLALIQNYLARKNYPFPTAEFEELLGEQKKRSQIDRGKKNITTF
jgi:alanyl-tRNA synthetase